MMEIIRYVSKYLLRKFDRDKDIIYLLSRSVVSPIVDKKRDINISTPIKIIIPDLTNESKD